ncbi:hypothetical protein ACFL7D_08465 [candidate division KSB1 bacterium]
MRCLIGIDGGGSNTRLAAVSEDGSCISSFTGDSSNFQVLGEKKVQKTSRQIYFLPAFR